MTCRRCRCHWRRDVRWRLQLHELHQTVALWTGALHIAGPKEVFQLNLLKKRKNTTYDEQKPAETLLCCPLISR